MGKHKAKEKPLCDSDIFKLAQMGDVALIKHLMEVGTPAPEEAEDKTPIPIDLEVPDHLGYTPLAYSCRQGHIDAVKLFIESGASVETATKGW